MPRQSAAQEDPVARAVGHLLAALGENSINSVDAAQRELQRALEDARARGLLPSARVQAELGICADLLNRALSANQRALAVYFDRPAGYGPASRFRIG